MFNQLYNPQVSLDRINNQIAELEKMKNQIQQPINPPTSLTQNFQLAPSRDAIRYATSIEEVQKDMVIGDTPYFSKDMSIVWVKNTSGLIKTYELNEIVPKDEKDLQIEFLMGQIEELKEKMNNEQYDANDNEANDDGNYTEDDKSTRATTKENKSTSISRVSKSKTR